ncbi:MAG TPA: hypothetical protein VF796_09340 [Humisphaera sp.]
MVTRTTTLRMLAATALVALVGCAATPPAGQSGVRVTARAEPKAGYVQPPDGTPGYSVAPEGPEDETTARRDRFRILDYRNLDDIVVYLTPVAGVPAAAPEPPTISADAGGRGRVPTLVTTVGGELRVTNSSAEPATVYLRGEGGAVVDVGTISPGGSANATLRTAGPVTALRETAGPDDRPIADVFVAPPGWTGKAVGGGRVTFSPVPPGRYTLGAWHPRLPGSQRAIELPEGKLVDETATVGVNVLPKVP